MSTSTLPPTESLPPQPEKPVLSLSATALVAGALAAMTSAVIGSHLGTAGTLTGAALGSVVGAAATALYAFGLQRTWHALGALPPLRAKFVAGVLLAALAAFIVALGAITGIEKVTGTSLAGEPGTTIEHARAAEPARVSSARQADPAPAAAAAEQAAPTASEATPTSDPTATQTPAPADPVASTQPGAAAPTDAPTTPAEPTPSAPAPADPAPVEPSPATGASH